MEDGIITAVLHDALDNSEVSLADIAEHAGERVAELVRCVAQLSRNNQLARRHQRSLLERGHVDDARAAVEAMKSMILQMTHEPLVRRRAAMFSICRSSRVPCGPRQGESRHEHGAVRR